MKKLLIIYIILSCIFVFVGCEKNIPNNTKESKVNITIGAASSLLEVLNEIKPKFEQETGINLTLNFASSGTLEKQIEQGAPVDVFISASKKYMDVLDNKNLVDKNSIKIILENKLVLIVSEEYKDKIKNISEIAKYDIKIGIGEPESVPAGQYAKESLIYLGLWDKLQDKFVYAKNVKQVVSYVDTGNVDAGIVYNSDVIELNNGVLVEILEDNIHKPINYIMGIVSSSKYKTASNKLYEYLISKEAINIFEKYGFNNYD